MRLIDDAKTSEDEKTEHLVSESVVVTRRRRLIMKREFLTPEEVKKATPKDLIRLFRGLDLDGN